MQIDFDPEDHQNAPRAPAGFAVRRKFVPVCWSGAGWHPGFSVPVSWKARIGPGPHRHPYDEIQFIREGRGIWTVDGKTFEGGAGDIFVIKAGEVHSFKAIGDTPLVQLDVHLSPKFIQENL
ncbi:MAG TPA: cupin domain-containing protein [Candidatus Angelobacter sp.]|jgi:hypothetical protein